MSYIFILLLNLFLLGHTRHVGQKRIIGGHIVSVQHFPYMAGLVIKWKPLQQDFFSGGAVIISDYWAITAAHCVDELRATNFINKGKVFVRSNTTFWSSHPGDFQHDHLILKSYIHDLYDTNSDDYDVAVLRVQERFTAIYERPIKLADATYKYKPGTAALVLGWGTTKANVDPFTVPDLRAVDVKVVDQQTCVKSYQSINETITPRMLCAGDHGRDACVNDSGGPLADGNVLIGLVSWGVECASDKYPGVYTKVSTISKWVKQTLNQN